MANVKLLIWSAVLAIACNVLYHLCNKAVPKHTHALVSLIVCYATALVGSVLLWPFFCRHLPVVEALKQVNWASVGVGVTIVGIEGGVLLAYRYGLSVHSGALVMSTAVAILLLPIGAFVYDEEVTQANILGIALCIGGIALVCSK